MEEEIEISYLEHEIANNKELLSDYCNQIVKVDKQEQSKKKELIRELRKEKLAIMLTEGAVDACNFMAAVAILRASQHDYPVIDSFLVPAAFAATYIAMSHRSNDAIDEKERSYRARRDELHDEYYYYGFKYAEEAIDLCKENTDLMSQYKVKARALGLDERISR